jgi:hypothetical protein
VDYSAGAAEKAGRARPTTCHLKLLSLIVKRSLALFAELKRKDDFLLIRTECEMILVA